MIPDEEIKKQLNVKVVDENIWFIMTDTVYKISPYMAFRFSVFLEQALLEYKKQSGKTLDHDFSR